MNRQRLLDIAADAIRTDLLEPLGVHVPFVPIATWANAKEAREAGCWMCDGGTYWGTSEEGSVQAIYIAEWVAPIKAVAILAHEMVHAALGKRESHGAEFNRVTKAMGLVGPAEHDEAGPKFIDWFNKRIKPALA